MRVLLKSNDEPETFVKRKLETCPFPSDEQREQSNVFKKRRHSKDCKDNLNDTETDTREARDGSCTNCLIRVNNNTYNKQLENPQESDWTKHTQISLSDGYVDTAIITSSEACPSPKYGEAGTGKISTNSSNNSDSNGLTLNVAAQTHGNTNKEIRYGDKLEDKRSSCIVTCSGNNKSLNISGMDNDTSDHKNLSHKDQRDDSVPLSNADERESGLKEQRPDVGSHSNSRKISAMERLGPHSRSHDQMQYETQAHWAGTSNEQMLSHGSSFSESSQKTDAQDILAAACSAVGIDDDLDSLMNSIDSSKQSAAQPSTLQNQALAAVEADPQAFASGKTIASETHQTANMNHLSHYPPPINAKPTPRPSDVVNGYPSHSGVVQHRPMLPLTNHQMSAVQGPVLNKVPTGDKMISTNYSRMQPHNWSQNHLQQQQQQSYQQNEHYYNQQQDMYQKHLYQYQQYQQPRHSHPQYYQQLQFNQQRLQYAHHMHHQVQQHRLPLPDQMLKENLKEHQHEYRRERPNILTHTRYPQESNSHPILYRGPHSNLGAIPPEVSQGARAPVYGKSNPFPERIPSTQPNYSTESQNSTSSANETANRTNQDAFQQPNQIVPNELRPHPQPRAERIGMEIVQPPVPLQSVKGSRKFNEAGLSHGKGGSVNVICNSPNAIQRVLNPAHNYISNCTLSVPNHNPQRSSNVPSEPSRKLPKSHIYPTPVRHSSSFDISTSYAKSTLPNSDILTDSITSTSSQTKTICVPPVDVLRLNRQEMRLPHHFIGYPQRFPQDHFQNQPKSYNFKHFTGTPPQPFVPSSISSPANPSNYNPEIRLRASHHQLSRYPHPKQQNTNTEQPNINHIENSSPVSRLLPSTMQPESEISGYPQWAHFRGRSGPYPKPETHYSAYNVRGPTVERHRISQNFGSPEIGPPPGIRLHPNITSKQLSSHPPQTQSSSQTNIRPQNQAYQRQFQDASHMHYLNYSHTNPVQHSTNTVDDPTNIRPALQNPHPAQYSIPVYPRQPHHLNAYAPRRRLTSPTQTFRNLPPPHSSTHPRLLHPPYWDGLQSTDKPITSEIVASRSVNAGKTSTARHQQTPKIHVNSERKIHELTKYIPAQRTLPVQHDNNQPLGLQRVGQCIAEAHSILLADSTHESSERTWKPEEWQKGNSGMDHRGPTLPEDSQAHSPRRSSYTSVGQFTSEMSGDSRRSSSETLNSGAMSFNNPESESVVLYHNLQSSKHAPDLRSPRNRQIEHQKIDYVHPTYQPLPESRLGNAIPGPVITSRTEGAQVRREGQVSPCRRDKISNETKYPYQVEPSQRHPPVKPFIQKETENSIDPNNDLNITSSEERIIKAMKNPYVLVTDIMKSKKVIREQNAKHTNPVTNKTRLASVHDNVQVPNDISHRRTQRNERKERELSDIGDSKTNERKERELSDIGDSKTSERTGGLSTRRCAAGQETDTLGNATRKKRFGDELSNFKKVRRLSIDDNKQLDNPSSEESNDDPLPDIEKQMHDSMAVIQDCPTDELPSCSYLSKPSNARIPIRKRICKEDELFASSARADTPPSPDNFSSYAPEWEGADCCSLPEIQKAGPVHFHEGTGYDTNSIEYSTSYESKECDKDTNPKSNDCDISDYPPLSPVREKDSQTRPIATSSSESSSREVFLEQLQPVLNTLLSAPEAGSLRYLLHDPGRLLEEMVYTWGGKPSTEENYLTKMKQNFENFLKLFVTPDKCSEWGWEGRSVEDILQLLNSDQGEIEDSDSRLVEETELRATTPHDGTSEHSQEEQKAPDSARLSTPSVLQNTDAPLVTSSISVSAADKQVTPEHKAREEPSPDSNCLHDSKGISSVVSSNLADSTITTSEFSCSPTSSDQTLGATSRCCCGHCCCNKSSEVKCPRYNKSLVDNARESNAEKKQLEQKSVRSLDTFFNSDESPVRNNQLHRPNAIIKSFATSTTDLYSSAHLELLSDCSISTEPRDACYGSTTTTFPTVDTSPSENG